MNKTITALTIIMASFAANASVLPETPVPFKSGTGAIDNDTVYIGLGSAGTAWYKLDTQAKDKKWTAGNDSNLLIVFYVQIMPDDLVMQLHRF